MSIAERYQSLSDVDRYHKPSAVHLHVVCSFSSNMAQVLEQLPAIRKLLESVAKSKCFEQVCAGQRLTIETMLMAEKCITAELASQLLHELQKMLWSPHDLEVLTDAVARKVSASSSVSQSPSSKLQNFESLHLYFGLEQWDALRSSMSADQKMDLIVSHAVTLGLRFPMEPTVQKIVGLYCMMSNGYNQAMSLAGSMKLEFVKFAKKRVKALGISPPTSLVLKLPVDTRDFQRAYPSLYQTVFIDGPPVACPLDLGKLKAVQSSIPMRITHKDMRPAPHHDPSNNPMQAMLSLLMQTLGQGKGEAIPIQLLRPPQKAAPPPELQLFAGSSSSGSNNGFVAKQLAIGDEQQVISDEDVAEPQQPFAMSPGSSALACRTPAKPAHTMSVAESTDLILASISDRTKRNAAVRKREAAEISASGADTAAAARAKAKAAGKKAAAPVCKAGAKAKGKSGATVSVERSRNQVLARTGQAGLGNSKSFKYKTEKDIPAARRSATRWLTDKGYKL
jgi:hypothetical protein